MKNSHIFILVVILAILGIVFVTSKHDIEEDKMEGSSNEMHEMDNTDAGMPSETGSSTEVEVSTGVSIGNNVKEFTVIGGNFTFAPKAMTVNKGDTVKIIFKNTQGFHDFVLDEFGVKSKQGQGPFEETLTFVADKTGSFEYYCSVGTHRQMGMKGTLTVK